jgi:predicted MFS family arabinose efflux permease
MAGYVIGVVLGGQLAEAFGWRTAFLVVGLPGILLAVTAQLILKEPRHLPAFAVTPKDAEPLRESFRVLMTKPSFVNILISMVLYFLIAYGAFVFVISFMIRAHGISVGRASALFGVVSTVGALVGNAVGGTLTDRLAKTDVAWMARLPGYALLAAFVVYESAFVMPSLTTLIGVLVIGGVLLTGAIPPMFAALHHICGSKRRAMSVAIIFFFANLIGLGLGPVIAGRLSDTFAKTMGPAEGLRYAMMLVMVTFLPCGYYMLRAGRTLKADAEA